MFILCINFFTHGFPYFPYSDYKNIHLDFSLHCTVIMNMWICPYFEIHNLKNFLHIIDKDLQYYLYKHKTQPQSGVAMLHTCSSICTYIHPSTNVAAIVFLVP